MNPLSESAVTDDLSTLSWVHEELRRSLENAHKALRRFVKESEAADGDLDSVDPSVLRTARQNLHQGVGALELVGLPAAAAILRAAETAVQRCSQRGRKLDLEAIETIERASFALLDFIARRLAGQHVSPLAMFPRYRAVQELAGADRIHPADLWTIDWHWRDIPISPGIAPLPLDADARARMEPLLLRLMRGDGVAAAELSDLCAASAAAARTMHGRVLWQLAAAFFEAQARGLLAVDVYGKRAAARLLAQTRGFERGDTEVSERLAQDLLFFCARARLPDDAAWTAPRLLAVRERYVPERADDVDYETESLGRFDPAWLAQARKRVAGAKEVWSALAAGETQRLVVLGEHFALVGDSLQRLFDSGAVLAEALKDAAKQTEQSQAPPSPELAMEVATALLYVEASLDESDFGQPQQTERIGRLAERIWATQRGESAGPLEPWMEELYRRVSDRQTMGTVVQELRVSLAEAEKSIDQFFRNPDDRAALAAVPAQLASMRGVLSVLGMDEAAQATLRMRDDVDELIALKDFDPAAVAASGRFERMASNFGALGFLIDMLAVQPHLAKALFVYDAAAGTFSPIMGREARHAGAGDAGDARSAPRPMSADSRQGDAGPVPLDLADSQPALTQSAPLDLPARTGVDEDDEMREIFLEEAREVIEGAGAAVQALARDASDIEQLTAVRRAFHTLKGSGHMVGLDDFGAAAWACERLYNVRLADAPLADRDLLAFTRQALAYLADWVDCIEARRDGGHASVPVAAAADALRTAGRSVPLPLPGVPGAEVPIATTAAAAAPPALPEAAAPQLEPWEAFLPPGLPSAADLDFGQAPAPAQAGFELRLRSFDDGDSPFGDIGPKAAPARAQAHRSPSPPRAGEASLEDLLAGIDLDFGTPQEREPGAAGVPVETPLPALPASAESQLGFVTTDFSAVPSAGGPAQAASEATEPAAIGEIEPHDTATAQLPFDTGLAPLDSPAPAAAMAELFEPFAVDDAAGPIELATAETAENAAPALQAREAAGAPVPEQAEAVEGEAYKCVGPLRIPVPLFNIFLAEADDVSRRLSDGLTQWSAAPQHPLGESGVALAHSLAGSSATIGFADLSRLARSLEHALMRMNRVANADQARLFVDAADEIRRLLHQFAAGFLRSPSAGLLDRLEAYERPESEKVELPQAPAPEMAPAGAACAQPPVTEPHVQPRVAGEIAVREEAAAPAGETPLPALQREPVAQEALSAQPPPEQERVAAAAPVAEEAPALSEPAIEEQAQAEPQAPAAASPQGPISGFGLGEFKPLDETPSEPAPLPAGQDEEPIDVDDEFDAVDVVDAELFSVFEEEGLELIQQLAQTMREWHRDPGEMALASACMRTLHTLKGGARLAGAMRLGEMAHRLETSIEHLIAGGDATLEDIEALQARVDSAAATFEALREREAALLSGAPAPAARTSREAEPPPPAPLADGEPVSAPAQESVPRPEIVPLPVAEIDWSRFIAPPPAVAAPPQATLPERRADDRPGVTHGTVRVRAPLLERLVNHAGEVSITRARVEGEVASLRATVNDLSDNLERLRRHLRDLELQAETQIASRMEAARAAAQAFDPLEMDRFTRFQELTRMMAESVNDVATVQRTLSRTLASTEDELAAQARLTRELQDDLLRTRMVQFDSLSDRLYRVVRQAAKETGKQVRLDIVGGSTEIDRGVLERMTGAFEHLLRNCVSHGIEMPAARVAAGKDAAGRVVVTLTQEGNEVGVEVRDDGAGLDLAAIRAKGLASGLLQPERTYTDADLSNLIFAPGFSTATAVTELAGRGFGMDVVRADVNAMGGRIETATAAGRGTSFKLVLPLTTAVTQVVMVRCAESRVAVPATLLEGVLRAKPEEVEAAYASGTYAADGSALPFFWLGALLQGTARGTDPGRTQPVVVVRSANQRVALHVDEVIGNQEVVVKHLGPQLSRLPGLAGVTLLASGSVALIYNPVALAAVYGDAARERTRAALVAQREGVADDTQRAAGEAPLVMVVDDSLTVRRITQRLLAREGYRVALAKDGLEALDRLAAEKPVVLLSDIEMPRMDGFDLVRNLRSDERLKDIPVIMITSRIAQKHRDVAAELGVNHYLGKPYSEEELLSLVARYAGVALEI